MKFLAGLVFGAIMSFAYVRYNLELPAVFQFPGLVQNAAIATAVDADLYDLDKPPADRQRALEVYFQAQPKKAAEIDWKAGSPFLTALYKRWATRQARQLKGQWTAFDTALEKPELRKVLERAHGTADTVALKQAMLWKAYQDETFLKAWLQRNGGLPTKENLHERLIEASKGWPVRM